MSKDIDWAVIFARLSQELPVSKVAKLTGLSTSAIHNYKAERKAVNPEHDKYVKAMLLYLELTAYDIPVIGQYHADFEETKH